MSNTTERTRGPRKPRPAKNPRSDSTRTQTRSWQKPEDGEEEIAEGDQCIICAEKIDIAAISSCNHTTCHKCTFRQRCLFEKKACLVCRTENDTVIFTSDRTRQYSSFQSAELVKTDEKYGIQFTSLSEYNQIFELLKFRCPICIEEFPNMKRLSEHVKADHEKLYCLICATNKKAFPSELKLYTFRQLQRHQQQGDEDGFEGHPACQYCSGKKFYSEDEMNIHIRHHHERCHICDQSIRSNPNYYRDYDSLYEHYKHEHFVCNVPACVEHKFVVFKEEMDLTAHMLREHGNIYNGTKTFVIGANYGYESSSRSRFQSQLSTFQPQASSSSSSSSNNNRNKNRSTNTDEEVDSFETKQKRLEERARHYLIYNNSEINEFLSINRSYKSGSITAPDVLQGYKKLFKDKENADLSILVYELSELFPETSTSRKELIQILDTFKKNDDSQSAELFPVLGGSSSSSPNNGSWSSNNTSQRETPSKRVEKFPALSKPKPTTPIVNNPIKYKSVIKKGNTIQSVKINTAPITTTYKPTYLSATPKPKPASSSRTPLLLSKPTNPRAKLADSNFPELPKTQKKPPPPRVNPITIDPKKWGTQSSGSSMGESSSNGSESNGKKKSKKVLYQFGI